MATTREEIPQGTLDLLILKTLDRHDELHGFEIANAVQTLSQGVLQVEEGSLYPALQRLLKEGLLKAEWQLSSTNRRVRTYSITRAGIKHLDREVSRFERMFEGINLVLSPTES